MLSGHIEENVSYPSIHWHYSVGTSRVRGQRQIFWTLFPGEEISVVFFFCSPECPTSLTSLETAPRKLMAPKKVIQTTLPIPPLFTVYICIRTGLYCAGYHSCIIILLSACVTRSSFLLIFSPSFSCRKAKNAIKSFNLQSLKLVSRN